MKILCVVVAVLLLQACNLGKPAPEECTDYRMVTFYDRDALGWSGAKSDKVCVVSERKLEP